MTSKTVLLEFHYLDVDWSECGWEWFVWVGVERVGAESIGVKFNERIKTIFVWKTLL